MFMPKIENWDNELANNIPPLMSQIIDTSKLKDNLDLSNTSKFQTFRVRDTIRLFQMS